MPLVMDLDAEMVYELLGQSMDEARPIWRIRDFVKILQNFSCFILRLCRMGMEAR
jgi:hypothetical protein